MGFAKNSFIHGHEIATDSGEKKPKTKTKTFEEKSS